MTSSLSAFAPLRVIDHGLLDGARTYRAEATTLFVDLVGFTPLTDALGQFGSRGTEQLSEILRRFFGAVTERATARGGDPIAFGGDALTIVFDGDGPSTILGASELAAEIHRLTEAVTGTETLAGPLCLQARIGIARGPVSTRVARAGDRSVAVQLGEGLDAAVAAEAHAAVGEVHLDRSVDPMPPGESAGHPHRPVPGGGADGGATPDELARFVPPAIRGHLLDDLGTRSTHRMATAAFVGFPAVTDQGVTGFCRTVTQLMTHVDDCGGEVVQVSGGDKGVVALCVFGAPVGHDDDPLRAARAMLELRRRVPGARTGIATGPVFATWLGSERRTFPAHFGGALNIAARLMQAAQPHEILVDSATWLGSGTYLRQRGRVRAHQVKGQQEPVEVRSVAGWRRRRRTSPSPPRPVLVGREPEIELIESLLDTVQSGIGCSATVAADPGVGKSRLAQEAAERARTRGLRVLAVDADDYAHGQVGHLWRAVVGFWLGIPADAERADWRAALARRLPEQANAFEVIGSVLGLAPDDRGQRPALAPDVAVELAQSVVARVVTQDSGSPPTLMVIENVHHLPPVSQGLVAALQGQVPTAPVGMLVTERTPSGRAGAAGRPSHHRRLSELSEDAAKSLAGDYWRQNGGGSPPSWLGDVVYRQAGGNPLFLRSATSEILRSWRPGDPPRTVARGGVDSLASLLSERLDLLDQDQQRVLAVLAVSGRPCALRTIVGVLSESVDVPAVVQALERAHERDFVRVPPDRSGESYRLAHGLLRHVIYERMSHAERGRLHRAFTELLTRGDCDPREVAEHVRHLDDPDLARTWYPRAAAEARRSWEVSAAIEWWTLSVPLLTGRRRDEAEVELLELLLVGGQSHQVLLEAGSAPGGTGAPGDRVETSGRLGDLAVRRRSTIAEAALAVGDLVRCEAECAVLLSATRGVDEARHQHAAELLVRCLSESGRTSEAVATAREQLDRAKRTVDGGILATANASLGSALLAGGDPSAAEQYYESALSHARSAGDVIHEIHVLSDLAGCAYGLGDHARCLELLGRARARAEEIGYRRHLMFSLNNEAQLRAGLGDRYASLCAKAAVDRWLEVGDATMAADDLHTWLCGELDLADDAQILLRLGRADARLGRALLAAENCADAAVAAARRGDRSTVLLASEQALAFPDDVESDAVRRRIEIAEALLRSSTHASGNGDDLPALTHELGSVADTQEAGSLGRAELRVAVWRIDPDEASHAAAVADLEAAFAAEPSARVRSLMDEIGMDIPPDPHPLPPPVGISGEPPRRADFESALAELEATLDARAAG